METETQVSAGGIVVRRRDGGPEVALVLVGERRRWQLPKGIVEPGEAPEAAAVRETREEAGVDGEVVAPVETVEYWYQAARGGRRVRYHKFVHFYLLAFRGGDVARHDHEVLEARWFPADEATRALGFPNERKALARALALFERDLPPETSGGHP